MKLDEARLKQQIKAGGLSRLYMFYGRETFLVETYTKKIISACLSEDERDFNFVRFEGCPTMEMLTDSIDTLPVFSAHRVVLLSDLDAERLDAELLTRVLEILSNIPPETVVIISHTGLQTDVKKAKTKKLLAAAEKHGTLCEFVQMSAGKISDMIIKKMLRQGCTISQADALYLAELALRDLTLIGSETDKLCAYAGPGGVVTREVIDALVSRQLEAGVYTLAAAITGGKRLEALRVLDEVEAEGYPSVVILSALSTAFVDFYCVKLGMAASASPDKIAADFAYQKNRTWVIGKTMQSVRHIKLGYIRACLGILSDADYKLKSSPVGDMIILEQAIVQLLSAQEEWISR